MYAKSTRPSAKRKVQKERSAKRDDQIALKLKLKLASDENVPAKRADFFYYNSMGPQSKIEVYIYMSLF